MGLDLHHFVPSVKNEESFDYFTIDQFADNPSFLNKHQHLVDEVEDFEHNFEILVFPDLATKELVVQANENYNDKPILVGDIQYLKEQLKEIAAANSITDTEPLVLQIDDNILINNNSRVVCYYSVSYETSSEMIKVLFYSEKGYQRKGMSSKFYDNFENNKLYFDKNAVLKAAACLEPKKGDSKEALQQQFREQFIDNFIEGESIFFASW